MVAYESITVNNGYGTQATANMPSTRPDGDNYTLILIKDDDQTVTFSGWTQRGVQADAGTFSLTVYDRVGSSEPSSYSSNTWSGSETWRAIVVRVSDTLTPIVQGAHANSSSVTAPAISGALSGSLILRAFGQENEDRGNNPPSGHTTRSEGESGTDPQQVWYAVATDDTAGATDAATWGGSGSDNWAAVTIEYQDAGGGAPVFADIRQDIIDGITSAQSEATGWNAEVRDNLAVTDVVRTSDTVVTITLPASASYQIGADETIEVTIPASALDANEALIATPTFGVTADDVEVVRLNARPRGDAAWWIKREFNE